MKRRGSLLDYSLRRGRTKGQVTIFIVIGILLVASVSLFFLSRAGFIPQLLGGGASSNVNAVIGTCLEEDVEEVIDLIIENGGRTENSFYTTYTFKEDSSPIKIAYLCYSNEKFLPCVNQNPGLSISIESEIKTFLKENNYVQNCFDNTLSVFEKQGYEIESERLTDFDVELTTKRVSIKTDSEVTLTKSGETTTQENFEARISTKLYDLIRVVNEIVNKEAVNCDFKYLKYMEFYPQFSIEKFATSDYTEIYTVKHEDSDEKFKFAIRGCVLSI